MIDIMIYVMDSVITVNSLTGTEVEECNLRKP